MIMTSSITTAVAWLACPEKFTWNGVDIFIHFFTTPISILNLTTSSESQEEVVSNDILSEWKYSQLFTRVEYISVKTVIGQIDLPTPCAAMTPPQSIYRLLLTDGQQASQYPAVHCVHLADIMTIRLTVMRTWRNRWTDDMRAQDRALHYSASRGNNLTLRPTHEFIQP